jgi:hypothetical protein
VFCKQFRLCVPCQLENWRFVSFEFLLPPLAAHPLYNYYRTIACSAGLPCFCFTRNFLSFFLPGVARTAVSCLLLVCDVNLASSVPRASFCFFFFIASSAGCLFAINRSDPHPDDTLETRKGDKRWKRNTHNRRSIQISVKNLFALLSVSFHCVCERDRRRRSTKCSFFGQKLSVPFQHQKERAATGDSCQSILDVT